MANGEKIRGKISGRDFLRMGGVVAGLAVLLTSGGSVSATGVGSSGRGENGGGDVTWELPGGTRYTRVPAGHIIFAEDGSEMNVGSGNGVGARTGDWTVDIEAPAGTNLQEVREYLGITPQGRERIRTISVNGILKTICAPEKCWP